MPSILNLAEQLLELGRASIQRHQTAEGLRFLRRLINLPSVSPAVAAQANYLIAQVSFQRNAFSEANERLKDALEKDPANAQCHYLLAQSHDQDDEGSEEESLEHYEAACALAPQEGRMASAFALKMTRAKDQQKGLQLLQDCYREHGDDPAVVEDFVEGLMAAHRHDRAELVVTQAVYRNPSDDRFRDLQRRFEQRLREERLFGGYRTDDSDSGDILKFENFEKHPASKPRGPKRPVAKPAKEEPLPVEDSKTAPAKVPSYSAQMNLSSVLKQSGRAFVGQLYDQMGLMGKVRPDLQRKEIQTVLLQRSFLKSMIKRFSKPTQKLLRTVVQSGGFLPASVLFQTTGPDAPPPDYCQPLLQSGLMYLGKEQGDRRRKNASLVAVVPVDLLDRLADVLKIDLDAL